MSYLNFPDKLPKNPQVSNFFKTSLLGAVLFDTERHDEANSRFSQFCERA
jgi:hypothetical protein